MSSEFRVRRLLRRAPNRIFLFVIPVEAGIQKKIQEKNFLDTRFRGYDNFLLVIG
jgi:hypothetical protein